MTWRDRLPEGLTVTREDRTGLTVELGLPVGPDGMFPLRCPDVTEHQFGVGKDFLDGNKSDELTCPYCGHVGNGNDFFTEEARKRLNSAAAAVAQAYVDDALNKMFKDFERGFRSNQYVKVTTSRSPRRSPAGLFQYDVPESRRTVTHEACGLTYAVYGLAVYCPSCGSTAPHDQFAGLIEVQRRSLALFDELPADTRAGYEAAGVITRTYEGTVKDAFGALETLLREEFRRRVAGADAVLKGRGNVFQRLSESADLYREHLDIKLDEAAGPIWTVAVEGMALRHVLVHNNGVVDDRYVKAVPSAHGRVGKRVHVGRERAEQVLEAAATVARIAVGQRAP